MTAVLVLLKSPNNEPEVERTHLATARRKGIEGFAIGVRSCTLSRGRAKGMPF